MNDLFSFFTAEGSNSAVIFLPVLPMPTFMVRPCCDGE